VVAAMPVARLAVPGPGFAAANIGAPTQPRLPHGGRCRWARQLGLAAYAAPLVRHASLGERYRRAGDPGAARNGDILPTNRQLKPVSPTASIRGLAKWWRSDGGSKAGAASLSSCSNLMAHSP